MDFLNRIAVVTGGESGIGAATVKHLAERGADVYSLDVSYDTGQGEINTKKIDNFEYKYLRCDVSDVEEVKVAIEAVISDARKIDILVNNAGITGKQAPLWETSYEYWKQIYRVNVEGVFLVSREVIPHMLANGYGRVVNVASMAGMEGNARSSAYSSSKSAVIGMTKSLGKELAGKGVLVNAIAPTVFTTPINQKVDKDYHEFLVSRIPLGRPGEASEAAEMIGFLASDKCSFSTGAVFDLSGGRAVY